MKSLAYNYAPIFLVPLILEAAYAYIADPLTAQILPPPRLCLVGV
jgi:hypothetical protein